MSPRPATETPEERGSSSQSGSSLVMSMFVLALLTSLGAGLLFLANTDVKMNQADLKAKRVFSLAEAGLEDARNQLRLDNIASTDAMSLDDELLAAAGSDPNINFDVSSLRPTYDSSGNVTGFTGYGNDAPLKAMTTFGGGGYAAFLTNDPIDGLTSTDDTNDRVMISAIGTFSDRSVEIVQAIVERNAFPPLPSTITLLGPTPGFDGGSSAAKEYKGDDCDGVAGYTGIPGLFVPVVGTMSATAEAAAEAGVQKPDSYTTDGGSCTGACTVVDVSPTADPLLTDCNYLLSLAAGVRASADYVCTSLSPCSHWGSSTINTVTFVEGDLTLGPGTGQGFLWVTGELTLRGNSTWIGVIFVVGSGEFDRNGGGNGSTWGSTLVADVAGPDNIFGTVDDCTGPDAGFDQIDFQVSGGGNHDTVYCSDVINQTTNGFPIKIVDFRQR